MWSSKKMFKRFMDRIGLLLLNKIKEWQLWECIRSRRDKIHNGLHIQGYELIKTIV